MMPVTGNKYALVILIHLYYDVSLTSICVLKRIKNDGEMALGRRQIRESNIENRERINNLIGMLEDGRRLNAFA